MALPGNYKPGYPELATNGAWQKKKSWIDKAKSVTKTGLGAKLRAAKTAYDLVKFDLLDAEAASKKIVANHGQHLLGDMEKIDELFHNAKNVAYAHQRDELKAAIDALDEADTTAKQVAKIVGLSLTAKTVATLIDKELHKHVQALTLIERDHLDDFDTQAAKLKEHYQRG